MSLYIEGKLTKDWVNQQLTTDNLTGEKAGTLLTRLKAKTPRVSVAGVTDEFNGAIAALRYLDEDETSVDAKFKRINDELLIANTGVDGSGNYIGPSVLSGEDYLTLTKALDDERAKLSDRDPMYKNSLEELKIAANYSDYLSGALGTEANRQSYTDGKAALDNYMDRMGAAADPRQWMMDNAGRFTVEVYRDIETLGFDKQFPQYAGWRVNFSDPKSDRDYDRITDDAYSQWSNGMMIDTEYEQLIRTLRRIPEYTGTPRSR